jgi:hypothetical protein
MVSAGLCPEFNRGEKAELGAKKEPPENRRL